MRPRSHTLCGSRAAETRKPLPHGRSRRVVERRRKASIDFSTREQEAREQSPNDLSSREVHAGWQARGGERLGRRVEIEDGAVAIPDEILAWLGVKPGDEIEMHVKDGKIVLTKRVESLVH